MWRHVSSCQACVAPGAGDRRGCGAYAWVCTRGCGGGAGADGGRATAARHDRRRAGRADGAGGGRTGPGGTAAAPRRGPVGQGQRAARRQPRPRVRPGPARPLRWPVAAREVPAAGRRRRRTRPGAGAGDRRREPRPAGRVAGRPAARPGPAPVRFVGRRLRARRGRRPRRATVPEPGSGPRAHPAAPTGRRGHRRRPGPGADAHPDRPRHRPARRGRRDRRAASVAAPDPAVGARGHGDVRDARRRAGTAGPRRGLRTPCPVGRG